MRFREIASTTAKGFDYFTGGDFFREAQRNERAIVLEETGKDMPEGVAELSFKGSMRVSAEYAKGMSKVMLIVPFMRWTGIDGALKLSRRLRQKPSSA